MHEHVHVVDPPRSLAASLAETKKELRLTQVHHGSRQSDSCENQRTLTNERQSVSPVARLGPLDGLTH